jgi:hypothetical protein
MKEEKAMNDNVTYWVWTEHRQYELDVTEPVEAQTVEPEQATNGKEDTSDDGVRS